jgi:hypothetical protein
MRPDVSACASQDAQAAGKTLYPGRKQLVAVTLAVGLSVGANVSSAVAQSANGLDAFVGTWTINLERSTLGRAGPTGTQTRRSPTFTWVFTPDGPGLRMNIYPEYPAPTPAKTLRVIPDGKQHVCAMKESCLSSPGDPAEQSYAFSQVNSNVLARVFQVRGKNVEYNIYAVSQDGKMFVATSWNPETPEYHNVQVFEKRP